MVQLVRNTSNSRAKKRSSVSATHRNGSSWYATLDRRDLAVTVLPRGQHREEDVVAVPGDSRHRVGRLSNIVIEYRLTQNRF